MAQKEDGKSFGKVTDAFVPEDGTPCSTRNGSHYWKRILDTDFIKVQWCKKCGCLGRWQRIGEFPIDFS